MARRPVVHRVALVSCVALGGVTAGCATSPGVTLPGSASPHQLPGSSTPPAIPLTPAPTTPVVSTPPPTTPTPPTPPPPPPPTTIAQPTTSMAPVIAPPPDPAVLASVRFGLEPLAELPLLTAMVSDPIGRRSYLASQSGEVWMLPEGGAPALALDLRAEVSPWVEASERGLLGLGLGPVDGRLYVSYTDAVIDSHVDSYALDPAGRPIVESRRVVIFVDQPGLGHKGGGLAFEPDGTMYLALGDGGASDGRDAQDPSLLLGAVLRIRPNVDADGYTVPPDNPYASDPAARPELWAKGLRNPWGFCRDAATGDVWLGDVGNRTMEEIDRIPAGVGGLNFGWYFVEGTSVRVNGAPDGLTPPVFAYRHDEIGPAAIGGCVYRGTAIPGLTGAYVFADISGPAFAIGAGDVTVRLADDLPAPVTGFGILPDGELAVLTLYDGAYRLVAA